MFKFKETVIRKMTGVNLNVGDFVEIPQSTSVPPLNNNNGIAVMKAFNQKYGTNMNISTFGIFKNHIREEKNKTV